MKNFIDHDEIIEILEATRNPTQEQVKTIIQKSLNKQRLSLFDTALLVNANDPTLVAEIKDAAKTLKQNIYGKRIVLFAPLYIGNLCINNCTYCGFKARIQPKKEQLSLVMI
ncbi:2-iminoacetate synthase [Saccharicrinis fermentans DSM 9555 = JCM 21142]|uniref:2-iminoacetate synthase n=2 Tax=Saccharicrinis fermentans TaxID=982 RepID=W7Y0N6_9BACT|nr:2-iminoacetate synthase [Saccharicrinis fermentans DSM 9555 = JCM 21142]